MLFRTSIAIHAGYIDTTVMAIVRATSRLILADNANDARYLLGGW